MKSDFLEKIKCGSSHVAGNVNPHVISAWRLNDPLSLYPYSSLPFRSIFTPHHSLLAPSRIHSSLSSCRMRSALPKRISGRKQPCDTASPDFIPFSVQLLSYILTTASGKQPNSYSRKFQPEVIIDIVAFHMSSFSEIPTLWRYLRRTITTLLSRRFSGHLSACWAYDDMLRQLPHCLLMQTYLLTQEPGMCRQKGKRSVSGELSIIIHIWVNISPLKGVNANIRQSNKQPRNARRNCRLTLPAE